MNTTFIRAELCHKSLNLLNSFFKIINENNLLRLEYLIKTRPKFLSKPCRQFSYLGPLWPNQSCLFNKSKHASVSSMIFWSCSFLTFMTFLLTVCGSKKEEGYSVAVFHYSRPLAPPSGSPSYYCRSLNSTSQAHCFPANSLCGVWWRPNGRNIA